MLGVATRPRKGHLLRMNDDHEALHVILGAGQIGSQVAEVLLARGHRVRIVRRGAAGLARSGLEWVSGDITDGAFADEIARGADVVYDCMNPLYDQWVERLLPLGDGGLRAARTAGAKLVALDNLYMYGRPSGPMCEDSPLAPCSRKGALRVELAKMRLDAHQRGDVRVAIGRAGDFFGPNVTLALWGERFMQRVFAGKSGECFGDPDMLHSYSYGADVARALVTLGEGDVAMGSVWHLPTPPAETTRSFAARLEPALGVPVKLSRVSNLVLRGLGVFVPILREVAEMTYQWEVPYVIDDSRFRAAFGATHTPIDDAISATSAWARHVYAPALAAAA